jgi:disintegrin and metalloproteinase domain-containing protein 10
MLHRDNEIGLQEYFGGFDPIVTNSAMRLSGRLTKKAVHNAIFREVSFVSDDDLAEVRGLVTEDGLFDGTISTRLEDFYIEPVSRYVEKNSSSPNFHTIVYRSSDVSTPHLTQPCASQLLHLNNIETPETTEGHTASVHTEGSRVEYAGNNLNLEIGGVRTLAVQSNGSHGRGFESGKMNHFSEVADGEQTSNKVHRINREKYDGVGGDECQSDTVIESDGTRGAGCDAVGRSHKKKRSNRWPKDEATQNAESIYRRTTTSSSSRHDTYYYNPNVLVNGSLPSAPVPDEVFVVRHVHKRATVDPKKTTCMLYLQADHLFYQKYGTEEACIEVMTRHVQRVNSIYKATGILYC